MQRTILPPLLLLACCAAAPAQDKWQYNLLNPTPPQLMRELSTDRPDVTESAHTLDAGHFQVESSFFEYAYDDNGQEQFSEFSLLPSNLKVGLLNNADLQLLLEPQRWEQIRTEGQTQRANGFGDTQLRLKVSLWGNDEGVTALAVMPFVQFPTAPDSIGGNDHVEGGVAVPMEITLPYEFSLALMAELDWVRDASNEGYGNALVQTASLYHPLVGNLDGFVEYVGIASWNLDATYVAVLSTGLTYMLNPNTQFDAALQFGLSDSADDVRALMGISIRL